MRKNGVDDKIVRLEDYAPSAYLIPATSLTFDIGPQTTGVIAELNIRRAAATPANAPLFLNGDELELVSLALDGKALAPTGYTLNEEGFTIHEPLPAAFTLRIETRLTPDANTKLMGLYRSNGVFCTQCEAEGFRRITYFLDRPDVLSVYTVRIEADATTEPVLLSNGNPGKSGALKNGRHFAVWHDPHPKPSYLFALVAGDLGSITDRFVTASGKPVALAIFVEHGKEARATYAMDALKRSMRWDEQVYGLEYDLDVFNIVAVSDFILGAMENKGLNIFNDKYVLADPQTATDADYAGIEAIIAHEYFHNWTGNRITCRDWFQLCLKEGLTVYRDHQFSADQRSPTVRRVAEVRGLMAHQFPEDQGPLAHPVRPRRYREINNFYTATVYEKGSEIVRMLRVLLGDTLFRAGMDIYLSRHDGQAATVDEFLKAFEDASGQDLSQFAIWYHQAGTPLVRVATSYDAARATYKIELEQSVAPTRNEGRKRTLHIPLVFGLVDHNGQDIDYASSDPAVDDGVIHLRKRRQVIAFSGISQEPTLSINRGFSAPVMIEHALDIQERLFLAQRDPDLFNRWQSVNTVLLQQLVAATENVRRNAEVDFDRKVLGMLGETAQDAALEPAFRALILTIPSESDVAREISENIDPHSIHRAREALLGALAQQHRAELSNVYAATREPAGAFSPDSPSAGLRALRNAALSLLEVGDGGAELAARHYRDAGNMTDLLAALTSLVHRFPRDARTAATLADFETRFISDPLVMDKWFSVQATAPSEDTLGAVQQLTNHRAFSFTNPNRVRALIGAYAAGNQLGFHRKDGAGYAFLADVLIQLDATNPRLAARLATAFRAWRSLESGRRTAARATLSTLAGSPRLSTDLGDIIERTLA